MSKTKTMQAASARASARESERSAKAKEERAARIEKIRARNEEIRARKAEKHNARAEVLNAKREAKAAKDAEAKAARAEKEKEKKAKGKGYSGSLNVKGIVGKLRYVPLGEDVDSTISDYVKNVAKEAASEAVERLKEGDAQGASDAIMNRLEGQKTELLNTMFNRINFPAPDGDGEITLDYVQRLIEQNTGIDVSNDAQIAQAGKEAVMSVCREKLGIDFTAMGYDGEALGIQDLVDTIIAGIREKNQWAAMNERFPSLKDYVQRAKALADYGLTLEDYRKVRARAASRDYKARKLI